MQMAMMFRSGGSISSKGWLYLSVKVALKLREGWLFHPKYVPGSQIYEEMLQT